MTSSAATGKWGFLSINYLLINILLFLPSYPAKTEPCLRVGVIALNPLKSG